MKFAFVFLLHFINAILNFYKYFFHFFLVNNKILFNFAKYLQTNFNGERTQPDCQNPNRVPYKI